MSYAAITPAPTTPKRGPAEQFTGVAWVTFLLMPGTPTDVVMGSVTFESGCRNRWHSHPAGQVLVVTAGQGYYQEKGQPAQLIQPGDVVNIAPGVAHWHGATATNFLT
ncbi:MAG: cupin domain-containing protein, partial [Hymenobacter sp.]